MLFRPAFLLDCGQHHDPMEMLKPFRNYLRTLDRLQPRDSNIFPLCEMRVDHFLSNVESETLSHIL